MSKLQWTEHQYGCSRLVGLAFNVYIEWANGGYQVKAGNSTLTGRFQELEEAKAYAEERAFGLVYLMVSRIEDYRQTKEVKGRVEG